MSRQATHAANDTQNGTDHLCRTPNLQVLYKSDQAVTPNDMALNLWRLVVHLELRPSQHQASRQGLNRRTMAPQAAMTSESPDDRDSLATSD